MRTRMSLCTCLGNLLNSDTATFASGHTVYASISDEVKIAEERKSRDAGVLHLNAVANESFAKDGRRSAAGSQQSWSHSRNFTNADPACRVPRTTSEPFARELSICTERVRDILN